MAAGGGKRGFSRNWWAVCWKMVFQGAWFFTPQRRREKKGMWPRTFSITHRPRIAGCRRQGQEAEKTRSRKLGAVGRRDAHGFRLPSASLSFLPPAVCLCLLALKSATLTRPIVRHFPPRRKTPAGVGGGARLFSRRAR